MCIFMYTYTYAYYGAHMHALTQLLTRMNEHTHAGMVEALFSRHRAWRLAPHHHPSHCPCPCPLLSVY